MISSEAEAVRKKLKSECRADIEYVINYDVKNEWKSDLLAKGKIDEPSEWQLMCLYKMYADSLRIDCDVSLRSMVIYGIAFPFVNDSWSNLKLQKNNKKKYCFSHDKFEYIGDTMNSYSTVVNEFLRNMNKNGFIEKDIPEYLTVNGEKLRAALRYGSWEECVLDNYEDIGSFVPVYVIDYIRAVHTIGNFIPVPHGFNSPRYAATKDFWDLTLYYIFKWYETNDDSILSELLGAHNICAITECREWLSFFGKGRAGWDSFVEMNYMEDFVKRSEDKNYKYGMPNELWNGHFDETTGILPKDPENFEEFFTNAYSRIMARGDKIARKLTSSL